MAGGAGRGRPPCLTRETVARVVLEAGFPQLTFMAVRKHLGVGESIPFRCAPDRDELVRLGLGLATGSVEMPPRQGPWWQVLTGCVIFAWRFWEAHPGSTTEVPRGVFTLVVVRLSDELCSFLMEYGLMARNALLTYDLVFDIMVDSCRGVERMGELSAETGPERNDMKRRQAPDGPEENPVPGWGKIRQAKFETINLPSFNWFIEKLEVTLVGVVASLTPRE